MTPEQQNELIDRRIRESDEIEDLKAELAHNHGIERNRKFYVAWRIAWGYGHSSGLHEVKSYFDELAELLKD